MPNASVPTTPTSPLAGSLPVAVITGGSSGIGYALAKRFLADGYHVVLIARRAEALQAAARALVGVAGPGAVSTLVADLSQPASPNAVAAELGRRALRTAVLVNNAGFGVYGHFVATDAAAELQMLQVHVTALTQLTKRLLPDLIASRGRILNVASVNAFYPAPLAAVYAASKAYVLSFSEALANELRERGVSVTALCPGPTPTGFQQRAGVGLSSRSRGYLMSAEDVAEIGYRGLLRGQRVVIPGRKTQVAVWLARLLPRGLVVRLIRNVQERRG